MNTGQFNLQGFALIDPLLLPHECNALEQRIDALRLDAAGSRNFLMHPWCADLARRIQEDPALSGLLPVSFIPVQCTLFEKSADRNWLVPVHQDLSIPVREKIVHSELSGWSEKEGCLYVHAPLAVLEQLLIVRLHIDDCGPDDGPLRVVSGSHRLGRLDNEGVLAQRSQHGEQPCCSLRGGALVMRPLLLHASSKASGRSLRRVLHFVFGPPELPFGLRWGCLSNPDGTHRTGID